ncbi:alpha/beta-hydrolase [Aaosphaeria arxii CBS 175.79]|uniref:Alpha/beta-hydrolase n=1 Tax=Aaosphaeria arxii CBS 175.79 TaxID=1450172 RepID=A0A6A5X9J8_9PLEO|nr:alpha/beta-hydrolase [Aaosphaeria arxii CBS 175.79]KAF2009631.1 alpha/beta-hydrolase [Aaosphaeria arxii CBS 175.79]
MTERGIFPNATGLSYRCDTLEGTTTTDAHAFEYTAGKAVTFSIGRLEIGKGQGKALMTITDLVPPGTPTFDPKLINRARLFYSLIPGQGFEADLVVDDKVTKVIEKYADRINLDAPDPSDLDGVLSVICGELGLVPKTVAHTRNHLRRESAGFKVLRDVKIPMKDGGAIFGDVYLPLEHAQGERYPVLVSCTLYGRRVFHSGPDLEVHDEIVAFEEAEDLWYTEGPDVPIELPRESWGDHWDRQRGFENIASFNTFTYVPAGYAMVKIDPPGVSQTPGKRGVPGELAAAFYEAVEWSAEQSWSDGNVGLVGSSYGANTQWAVASLRPKGLKCFVPYATDIDTYRDAVYPGGIPTRRYITDWFSRVKRSSPKWGDHIDLAEMIPQHPFHEPLWDMISAKVDSSDIPCFLAAPQIFIIHGRGAYEAWRARKPENTHLQLTDCDYYPWPSREASNKVTQFLDNHLKGYEYPKPEAVGIQMRLGWGTWYWRKESAWPVPGTTHIKWHLNADGKLSRDEPMDELTVSYAANAPATGKSGVSFVSAPLEEDVEMAGHFSAVLNVSSTAVDADVVVTLWAISDAGEIVPYSSKSLPEPVAKGFLRASHRKLDLEKTLPERPWHTHLKDDHQPLQAGEVVQLDVEIFPAAARIKKGWKLRLDVTPSESQPDIPSYLPPDMRNFFGEENEGTDSIHIGGGRSNFIYCPVVPVKQGYPNLVM